MRFSKLHLGPNKCSPCPAYFQRTGKIYFGIFGVCLVFLFFLFLHIPIVLKKRTELTGPCPSRTLGPADLISRGSRPSAQPKTLPTARRRRPSRAPPPPHAVAAAGNRRRRRRFSTEKPIGFSLEPAVFLQIGLFFILFFGLVIQRTFVRTFVFTNGFHRLAADSKRSFISLFVSFL